MNYEELSKQNRLIVLPCGIGDTVYVLRSKCVESVDNPEYQRQCNEYLNDMNRPCLQIENFDCDNNCCCPLSNEMIIVEEILTAHSAFLLTENLSFYKLGKNVFRTREEAESKIKGK